MLGLVGTGDDVGARLVDRRMRAEQAQRLGGIGVVGEVVRRAARSTGRRRGRWTRRHEHRQRRHALAQVGAGGLAGLARVGGDVEDVVGELEGRADDLAVAARAVLDVRGAPPKRAPKRADVAIREPSCRRGPQVVLDGSSLVGGRRRSRGSGPRPGGRRSRAWIAPRPARDGSQLGGLANRKSPVRIATVVAQRGWPRRRRGATRPRPSRRRGKRRQVGELDDDRRGDDVVGRRGSPGSAASRASSGRNRLPPASTGGGRLGDERRRWLGRPGERSSTAPAGRGAAPRAPGRSPGERRRTEELVTG